MKACCRPLLFLLALILPSFCHAALFVGIGKREITPSLGTPSAGYTERKGAAMEGVHDPLFAIAITIDNGEKRIVLCSVDNLGFTYKMAQEVTRRVQKKLNLSHCEIYIGSSHTHSGGGAFLDIPLIGEALAGPYDPNTTDFYIDKTAQAIVDSSSHLAPAKIGIGYGTADNLSRYRGLWPEDVLPLRDVAVLKIVTLDDRPIAALFNYPVHPTVLTAQNRQFSADFVGCAREHLQEMLGGLGEAIYFNGAQGDLIPSISDEEDRFQACDTIGKSLAGTVKSIWDQTETSDQLEIETKKLTYSFKPEPTPFGLSLPLEAYSSEMNLIVLNKTHAFLTIPGELSTLYDRKLKKQGEDLGYSHVSILGLTNDAHGYIILPESWENKTYESKLSFGGKDYGDKTEERAKALLLELYPH